MLFSAKYVIPVTQDYIEDGAVLVQEDSIADVGKADDLRQKYPNEEFRDLGQAALLPGFVDAHTHMDYTALRGRFDDLYYSDWKRAVLRMEPFFEEDDWLTSARMGAMELVASGVTTIADITSHGRSFDAVQEIGLRARIYQEVITVRSDHVSDVIETGAAKIEDMKARADNERISFGMALGPIYACHPELLKAVSEFSTQNNLPLALHLAGSNEEVNFVRYGSSPFSIHASDAQKIRAHLKPKIPFLPWLPAGVSPAPFLPWLPAGVSPARYVYDWGVLDAPDVLAIHCVHVNEEDIALLADKDVNVVYCPRINAKLCMGSAPLLALKRAGLSVGLGTDSPCATDTSDMIEEARFGLMLTRAMHPRGADKLTAKMALKMATIDGARVLHMEDEIGSLEKGKKADIIAIDLHNSHQNPTTNPESAVIYTANQDNVMMNMVGGKVLYDNFVHVSSIDRDAYVKAAQNLRQRLRKNTGDDTLHDALVEKVTDELQDRYSR